MVEIRVPYTTCSHCGHFSGPPVTIADRQMSLLQSRSNDALSRKEKINALMTILEGNVDIAKIDDEISRLQASILQLKKQRDIVQQYVDYQKKALSVIHSLPDDVLAEIFLRCREDGVIDFSTPRSSMVESTLKVSRRWRAVALSQPRLWSSVKIDFDVAFNHYVRFNPRPSGELIPVQFRLRYCLERSSMAPLKLALANFTKDTSILDMLVAHSKRWESITLSASHESVLQSAFASLRDRLPLLRDVILKDYRCESFKSVLLDLLKFSPRLSNLTLIGITFPEDTNLHLIETDQQHPTKAFLDVLRGIPALDHLSWGGTSFMNVYQPVGLSRLRSLKILTSSVDAMTLFFQAFTMPLLNNLEVGSVFGDYCSYPTCVDALCTLLRRSACSLAVLSLDGIPETFIPQIIKLPEVSTVEIFNWTLLEGPETEQSEWSPTWMPALNRKTNGLPFYLNNMHTLRLIVNRHISPEFTIPQLMDLVEARTTPEPSSSSSRIDVLKTVGNLRIVEVILLNVYFEYLVLGEADIAELEALRIKQNIVVKVIRIGSYNGFEDCYEDEHSPI